MINTQTHRQTDRKTDRHVEAAKNNTCIAGALQVINWMENAVLVSMYRNLDADAALSLVFAPLHFIVRRMSQPLSQCFSSIINRPQLQPCTYLLILSISVIVISSRCAGRTLYWTQPISKVCFQQSLTALFRKSLELLTAKQKQLALRCDDRHLQKYNMQFLANALKFFMILLWLFIYLSVNEILLTCIKMTVNDWNKRYDFCKSPRSAIQSIKRRRYMHVNSNFSDTTWISLQ